MGPANGHRGKSFGRVDEMKKFLLFADGMSTHTLKWAQELSKHFELYVLSFSYFREEFYTCVDKSKLFDLQLEINSSGGNAGNLLKLREVASIIRMIKPDVINAHYVTSYGFMAALIKKIYKIEAKLIISTWGSDILVTPFKNKVYWYITKFALRTADLVTSDSYFMSDKIMQISGRKPMTFPFGIKCLPNDMILGDKDETLFFSNRSLSKNYNIDKIIKYFSELLKKNPKLKLVIANEGNNKFLLEEMVRHLGIEDNIDFVGFLNEEQQNQFYKKSQFYISVPDSDATSVSLLEAMSFGCIPIVSNISANREWIIRNVNGFYFDDDIIMDLPLLITKREEVYDLNRKIISRNGIWCDNIIEFIKEVDK